MRNHIASTYPSSYKEERVWTWCSLIDKVLFTTFLFFTVGLIQAQAPCSTTGSNNFVGALPETEQDFIGTYFIRIFPQVVRLPGGGGSSPSDEAIIAALNQMSLDFAPHNIFFVWDCEIISIENENLYVYFPAQQCSLLYDNLYGHENGIDIFFGPGEGTSGFGSAAGIGSKTIVMNGATFGTSRWLSHEMGHCLGLWHTHHGTATEQGSECPGGAPADPEQCAELPSGANSSVCGDYIHYDPNPLISTPADPEMASNVDPNTCVWNGSVGSPYNPDERNIMAYSIPSCMQYFATLQGSRMRYTIANNATVQACLTSYDYSHVTVNQTETWTTSNTLNNGNVSIVEALIIESGATLTIENGVVVRFREQGKIIHKTQWSSYFERYAHQRWVLPNLARSGGLGKRSST